MLAAIWRGYKDGVKHNTVQHGQALYGDLMGEHRKGVDLLLLWPLDYPHAAKAGNHLVEPIAKLWRPTYSGVFVNAIAFAGLECTEIRGARRWQVQRWYIEPKTRRSIQIAQAYDRDDRGTAQQLVREGDDENRREDAAPKAMRTRPMDPAPLTLAYRHWINLPDGEKRLSNHAYTAEEGQRRWPGSVPDLSTASPTGSIAGGFVAVGQGKGWGSATG